MNASMHRYFSDYRFRLLASHFFLRAQKEVTKKKGTPIPAPASCGFPAMLDQHRSLRNSTFAAAPLRDSNSARSFPVLLCASRRLQGGQPSPTTSLRTTKDISAKAPGLAGQTTPLWSSRALQHSAETSERVSEPQASFRSRRRMRSAQGIGCSAAETDCGTGPAFFGYFLCRSKESHSPAGENITSVNLNTGQLIRQ